MTRPPRAGHPAPGRHGVKVGKQRRMPASRLRQPTARQREVLRARIVLAGEGSGTPRSRCGWGGGQHDVAGAQALQPRGLPPREYSSVRALVGGSRATASAGPMPQRPWVHSVLGDDRTVCSERHDGAAASLDLRDEEWRTMSTRRSFRSGGHESGPRAPLLAIALDPAGVEFGAARLDATGGGRDGLGDRWWTLPSQSLEILPTGTWRVMATLTTRGSARLVELHLEVDPRGQRQRPAGAARTGGGGSRGLRHGQTGLGVPPAAPTGVGRPRHPGGPRTSAFWLPGTPTSRRAA
jgi:hypothetical protein